MADFISFVLSNFTLTFLVLGLIAAAISLWRRPRPLRPSIVVEDLFACFLLFTVGITHFYSFVFHVFFGDMAAKFIGWKQSPFQAEVGFASLGFSVIGFLASPWRRSNPCSSDDRGRQLRTWQRRGYLLHGHRVTHYRFCPLVASAQTRTRACVPGKDSGRSRRYPVGALGVSCKTLFTQVPRSMEPRKFALTGFSQFCRKIVLGGMRVA
jgi:hypothetical protein